MARSSESIPNEPIFKIEDAVRAGMHLLIQLFGPPQCGKTLSALLLAYGIARELAGPDCKIGVMDTEGRARMFYDKIPGGFKIGELTRPFSAGRYMQGIELFLRHGVDVLMIDSFSHVWEGMGGVLDQAEENESKGRKGLAKWNKPKRDYNKMVSDLLTTRIPIIFCSRAKQPIKIEKHQRDGKEFEEWIRLPWEPIQDSRLKYEMTIVMPMIMDGSYETDPTRLKCPGDLRHIFDGEPVTIETGKLIGKWVSGGEPVNHEHELLRHNARSAAANGAAALRAHYAGLTEEQRLVLRPIIGNLKSAAQTADEARENAEPDYDVSTEADIPTDPSATPFSVRTAQPEQRREEPAAAQGEDSLEVTVMTDDDGIPDWEGTARAMENVIARLQAAGHAAVQGKFARDNKTSLDRMRVADRATWENVQMALSHRERELRRSAR